MLGEQCRAALAQVRSFKTTHDNRHAVVELLPTVIVAKVIKRNSNDTNNDKTGNKTVLVHITKKLLGHHSYDIEGKDASQWQLEAKAQLSL